MYCAYVTKLSNVRPHPNADRLLLGDCFGNTVCVPFDYEEGMLGVYFPVDGQVSIEFGEKNNLLRKKDAEGKNIGGYLDPDKRNIKAIRLRDEKSDGIFLPLNCLDYCYEDSVAADYLSIGDTITIVNGHEICQKYVPRGNHRPAAAGSTGNRTRKKKVPIAPLFAEHADTEQLAYNLSAFKPGDEIEITLKMHGTSQRTGYLPILKGYADSWAYKVGNAICTIMNKLIGKDLYEIKHDGDPIYDWDYVTGTRRTVLDSFDGGFYGNNLFREPHAEVFKGKLWKGETVYYEVVGYTTDGNPIMASADNSKINDKEFMKTYGKRTEFSYGCTPFGTKLMHGEDDEGTFGVEVVCPQSDLYVYRMTMTNEDGCVVEYTPDFMRYRCEQMGVKTVPVFAKVFVRDNAVIAHNIDGTCSGGNLPKDWTIGDAVKDIAERFYDGPDPIGKTHIREGVVVRILNRPKFCAYKHKNFSFKVLEGLIKDIAETPDMEEAESLPREEDAE